MKTDLSKLTIARLKSYRKSLLKQVAIYETCDCGDMGCDHQIELNKNRPVYLTTKDELEQVNKVLAGKQKKVREVEAAKKWAHVDTVDEQKRYHNPPWRELKKKTPPEKRKLKKLIRKIAITERRIERQPNDWKDW